jgi:hypothetical protein
MDAGFTSHRHPIAQGYDAMRQSTIVSVIATACLSIAVSLVAAALFLQPAPSAESSATAISQTVADFYDAANEVIATGNTRPLDAILSPGFVDREAAPGVTPDRDGLRSYLLALHTANPALRLRADPILGTSDRAMARVTLATDGPPSPSGSAISGSEPWAPVETFRVENAQIIERWSSSIGLSLIRPLAGGVIDVPSPTPRQLSLQRLTLPPGAIDDRWSDGPGFVFLERGTLQLRVIAHSRAPAQTEAEETITLAQGQSFAIPPFSRMQSLNVGGGDAQVLMVRFELPRLSNADTPPGNVATAIPNEGVSQILAGALAVDIAPGPWRLELTSLTLGTQAEVAVSSAAGPSLVAVTSGELGALPWGRVWQRRHADGMSVQMSESPADILTGDGLTVETGSRTTLVNTFGPPATAIVLSVFPINGTS